MAVNLLKLQSILYPLNANKRVRVERDGSEIFMKVF